MEKTKEFNLIKLEMARWKLLEVVKLAKKEYSTAFNRGRLYTPKTINERVEKFDKMLRPAIVDRLYHDSIITPFLYMREKELPPRAYGKMKLLESEMDFVNFCMEPVREWADKQMEIYNGIKDNIKTILSIQEELAKINSTTLTDEQTLDKKIWPKDEPKNDQEFFVIVKKCDNYLKQLGQDTQTKEYPMFK